MLLFSYCSHIFVMKIFLIHSSHENFINSLVSLEIVANAIDNRSSFCSRNVGVNNVLTAGSNVLSLAHNLVGVLLLEIH